MVFVQRCRPVALLNTDVLAGNTVDKCLTVFVREDAKARVTRRLSVTYACAGL